MDFQAARFSESSEKKSAFLLGNALHFVFWRYGTVRDLFIPTRRSRPCR